MKKILLYLLMNDLGFGRLYTNILTFLDHHDALSPYLMGLLLWRMQLHRIDLPYDHDFRVCIGTLQEIDEIRYMKYWRLKRLYQVLSPWQIRMCEEIKAEKWE